MNTNVLFDDETTRTVCIGEPIQNFESACGTENLYVRQIGDTTEIALGHRGVIDAGCISTFYDRIVELIAECRCRVLIFDLTGVWIMPSRTLGALISLGRYVERMELQNVSSEVRDVLRCIHMENVFHYGE